MVQSSRKRGQAAMEFLMTYGWAILVVLVVIGALAYFGVLSPDTLLPEKCTLPVMLNCKDWRVDQTTSTIALTIQNGAGRDLNVYGVNVTGDTLGVNGCYDDTYRVLKNGESITTSTSLCTYSAKGRSKDRYKIVITYSNADSSTNHTVDGELLAKAEK